MFFEQYSHEPAIAVLRYLTRFSTSNEISTAQIKDLEIKSRFALDALDHRCRTADWVASSQPTIADLALYPYTRLTEEVGLDVHSQWPAISDWLARIESLRGFLPVYSDAAVEVISFDQYFSN